MNHPDTTPQGTIVKGLASARPAVKRIVKRLAIEARAEAERILRDAESHAARVRERAEREAADLRERTSSETREAALAEFTELIVEARARRDDALFEVEREVLRLSVRIAEKIIGREIKLDKETLADIVAAALLHARQHQTLAVRVNPADLPLVQAHRDRFDALTRARFVDFVPDPRVGAGGCVIESEAGTIDATIDTQLRVLERALLARTGGA